MKANSSVTAIIVAFNPKEGLIDVIDSVISQVNKIIIYDNSSISYVEEMIRKLNNLDIDKIMVINTGKNVGIGFALNDGACLAIKSDDQYILTMDQDSIFPANGVERLKAILERDRSCAIASPAHGLGGLLYDKTLSINHGEVEVDTVMTSGNLVNLTAFRLVGGYRDDYFIDYVDHEFCLRLNKFGFKVIVDTSLVMQHALGEAKIHKLGKFFRPTHHAAFRRYYMTRNRVITYSRYALTSSDWVRYDKLRAVKEILSILLVEDNKIEKIRAILMGIRDGSTENFDSSYGKGVKK